MKKPTRPIRISTDLYQEVIKEQSTKFRPNGAKQSHSEIVEQWYSAFQKYSQLVQYLQKHSPKLFKKFKPKIPSL
jgi:hypothetical protein